MKTAHLAPVPAQNSSPTSKAVVVHGSGLRPNPWNPNRMTAIMYDKLVESIEMFGFLDPLTVRRMAGYYEVIDGEHRWQVGMDHSEKCRPAEQFHVGYTDFPAVEISGLTDAQAKKLTIIMNELHGQADPAKMGDLLNQILSDTSIDEMLKALPYDESVVAGFLQLPELPPLESAPPVTPAAAEQKEPWVERLYKMPKSVALVIDEAIEKARDGEEIEPWRGLERVAAEYLAS